MTEYTISFFGMRHTLLLLCATDNPLAIDRERGLAIIPDSHAVEDITAISLGRQRYSLWEGKILLSYFFRTVMGYPDCELLVRMDETLFTVQIFNTPHHSSVCYGIKCKLLSTFCYTSPDLTEHTLYTIFCDSVYRVVLVNGDGIFRTEMLPELRVVKGLPNATAALAVQNGVILLPHGERLTPHHVICAAVALARGCEGVVELSNDGTAFTVTIDPDGATLFTHVSLINSYKI